MGLTIAEAFMLLVFALLLLFLIWRWDHSRILEAVDGWAEPNSPEFEQRIELLETVGAAAEPKSATQVLRVIADIPVGGAEGLARQIETLGIERFTEIVEAGEFLDEHIDMLADGAGREIVAAVGELPEAARSHLHRMAISGSLEQEVDALAATEVLRPLVESESDLNMVKAISGLPTEEKRKLEDLVRSENLTTILEHQSELASILESGIAMEVIAETIRNNDAIARKLSDQAQAQVELASSISESLGDVVSEFGGSIGPHGRIYLPNNVGFNQGNDEIKSEFGEFLGEFCPKLLDILHSHSDGILEIRIEGHASSEWRGSVSEEEAYLRNLNLSQRRAHNVLVSCINQVPDTRIREWAKEHIVASGHSSSRPLRLPDNSEDREASRRVEFGYLVDYDKVLRSIRAAVQPDGAAVDEIRIQPERITVAD